MKWIALSFDDGEVQDKRLCALLRKYRLKATFGICCGYLGQSGILSSGRRYSKVSAEDLASVYEGFELCSHGYFHCDFTKLCEAELQEEVMRDCDCIREKTRQHPIGVIYPGGSCSDAVCTVLRKSFSFGRTAGASHSFALPEDFLRWEPTCHMFDKKIYELADAFGGVVVARGHAEHENADARNEGDRREGLGDDRIEFGKNHDFLLYFKSRLYR